MQTSAVLPSPRNGQTGAHHRKRLEPPNHRCFRSHYARRDCGFSQGPCKRGLTGDSNNESRAGPVYIVVRYPCKTCPLRASATTPEAAPGASGARSYHARLAHRAIQALRQAGLPCASERGHGPKLYLSVSRFRAGECQRPRARVVAVLRQKLVPDPLSGEHGPGSDGARSAQRTVKVPVAPEMRARPTPVDADRRPKNPAPCTRHGPRAYRCPFKPCLRKLAARR